MFAKNLGRQYLHSQRTVAPGLTLAVVFAASLVSVATAASASATVLATSSATVAPILEPALVTGSTSLTLNWTEPDLNTQTDITGYNIYEGTVAGGEGQNPVNGTLISASNNSFSVSGLQSGVSYYFTVKAVTTAGTITKSSDEVSAVPNSSPILYVAPAGSSTTSCSDIAPCGSIATALSVAKDGDTIDVEPGYYSEQLKILKDVSLFAKGSVTIAGTTNGVNQPGSNITIYAGSSVALSGFDVTGGSAATNGGGIANYGTASLFGVTVDQNRVSSATYAIGGGIDNESSLYLSHSVVSNNTVTISQNYATVAGGGVYNGGLLYSLNSSISNNTVIGANYEIASGDGGGGVYNAGNAISKGDSFSSNSVKTDLGNGGGIKDASGGTFAIANDVISSNSASSGGGIYSDGTFRSNNSLIEFNSNLPGSPGFGGGIYVDKGTFTSAADIISGNYSYFDGGGIYVTGSLSQTDSFIGGNSAEESGGGIIVAIGSANIVNDTISLNSAGTYGGGLAVVENGSSTATNDTIVENSASSGGGGIENFSATTNVVGASLIGGNSGGNCYGAFSSLGYNLSTDSSCGAPSSTLIVDQSLQLPVPSDNGGFGFTVATGPGSPAFDVIPVSSGLCGPAATGVSLVPSGVVIPPSDARGEPRPQPGVSTCSIGAYQYQSPVGANVLIEPPTNVAVSPGIGSASVSWKPSPQLGGVSISGYDLYISSSLSGLQGSAPTLLSPNSQSYNVASLSPGVTYYFALTTLTNAGVSPLSGAVSGVPIGSATSSPSSIGGKGYWLVASDGGVFSFGDATFYGSTGNMTLNKPIVGITSTPDGKGYWLVASDGGVFSFGDATFYGSTGNLSLNKPIVGSAVG